MKCDYCIFFIRKLYQPVYVLQINYIFQIRFAKFCEKLPLFRKCPCFLLNKQEELLVKSHSDAAMMWWVIIMVYYLCPRREKIRTSMCLFRSHPVMHTELVWDCEQTPLYHLSTSKWTLVSEESETAQTHKENLPSGRVLKINGWYLKLLNIVLDKEWAYSTLNFYLASYFQYPKTSSFSSLFSLWSITVGPSPEKEVTPNLGSPKIVQNCIIISSHITLHCNYLVT